MHLPMFGQLRGFAPMKPAKPMRPQQEMETLVAQAERDDARLDAWAQLVGDSRAREALELMRAVKRYRATLPELLAEVYLRARGIDYRSQVNLGFCVPDLVLLGRDGGCHVWRVQGDYWHSRGPAAAKDEAQRAQLMQATIYGAPVLKVLDVWEKRIYGGDDVLDMAMQGQEVGR
jgi:hypothetical protein